MKLHDLQRDLAGHPAGRANTDTTSSCSTRTHSCVLPDCHGLIQVHPLTEEERMAAETTMKEAFYNAGSALAELPQGESM